MKNAVEIAADLEPYFDFAINEECFYYEECETLNVFIDNCKAVLGVEYEMSTDDFCTEAQGMHMSFMKKNLDLDAERIACQVENNPLCEP